MTEAKDFEPIKGLRTPREQLLERIADPLGGVALVETGADAHSVLAQIDATIDAAIGPTRSEAYYYWGYREKDGERQVVSYEDSELGAVFTDHLDQVRDIYRAVRAIKQPIEDVLIPPEGQRYRLRSERSLQTVAARREQLKPSHVDIGDIVTVWLGATKPGLQLWHQDAWLPVDDVPPGWALMWRGTMAMQNGRWLKPTPHYAQYRSRVRRVIMVA